MTVREFLDTFCRDPEVMGFALGYAAVARGIGLDKYQMRRRLRDGGWLAAEVLRLHRYLMAKHVPHTIAGLLEMCASNPGGQG